jgi:pimeloyl-ACP methyl ester carboxylesterase
MPETLGYGFAQERVALLDLLDSYGIGDRPLMFITHSLGGLLVKQMLRNARDYGKWNAIASQTKGIVFLSTPHSGSDMASWIQHIGGLLRTTVSVEELEAHHSRLRELNLLYRNDEQFSQISMLIYCETRPTGPILVVNQTSADPGIKGVIPVPMDFDHISICKVADRKSQIYRSIKRFIEKNLTTPLVPIPLKLAEGEAIPQEIDRSQPQADNSMRQINQGDARAFQTKIQGGTAHTAERIDFYQSPNPPT